jgi:hypothetical protein
VIPLPVAGGLLRRLAPQLLFPVVAAVLLVGTHWKAYRAGAAMREAEHAAELDRIRLEAEEERVDALQRLNQAERQVAQMQAEAENRIAAAQKRATENRKTVERVARENPGFSSTVRPADLQRLRDDDLAAIEAAAGRSADLSGASLRGVRAAGEGEERGPR